MLKIQNINLTKKFTNQVFSDKGIAQISSFLRGVTLNQTIVFGAIFAFSKKYIKDRQYFKGKLKTINS